MTLPGGGVIVNNVFKKRKVSNFKGHELPFTTKIISVSCYTVSVQIKYQS